MFEPGQKVHFASDPEGAELTIKAVSPYVDMAELEEFEGGWIYFHGLIAAEPHVPDALDKQLKFLGF